MFNIKFGNYIYDSKINIYYLYDSQFSEDKNFLKLLEEKKVLSKIEFVIDNKEVIITSIYTQEEFRNKGFANFLLQEVIRYSKKLSVREIKLDSMLNSLQNNLFIKNGFSFINFGDGPEMIYLVGK